MSSCNELRDLIPTYLDRELADADLSDFEHHVADCDGCQDEVASAERVHEALRSHLRGPAAPEGLRERVALVLDAEDMSSMRQARRAGWSWLLPAVASTAAAAALALFVLSGPLADSAEEPESPVRVAHEAVRERFSASPVVVQGTRSEVIRGAQQYLQVPVRAPRFTGDAQTQVALLGWQRAKLRGRDAALFLYQVSGPHGRHRVNVHVLDARNLDLRSKQRIHVGDTDLWIDSPYGFSSVAYKDRDGLGYIFTTDMGDAQLVDLVVNSDILDQLSERIHN